MACIDSAADLLRMAKVFITLGQSLKANCAARRMRFKSFNVCYFIYRKNRSEKKSITSFVSIKNAGAYEDQEDEIRFLMHTVFQIKDIKQTS